MSKIIVALLVLLAAVGAVQSAESEIDTDLMRDMDDTNKSLSSDIAQRDAKSSTADARELAQMLSKVEIYYVEKGNADDAVDLARKSKQLTIDIARSVAADDFDAAMNSSTTLSRTCKTCHNFYKKS